MLGKTGSAPYFIQAVPKRWSKSIPLSVHFVEVERGPHKPFVQNYHPAGGADPSGSLMTHDACWLSLRTVVSSEHREARPHERTTSCTGHLLSTKARRKCAVTTHSSSHTNPLIHSSFLCTARYASSTRFTHLPLWQSPTDSTSTPKPPLPSLCPLPCPGVCFDGRCTPRTVPGMFGELFPAPSPCSVPRSDMTLSAISESCRPPRDAKFNIKRAHILCVSLVPRLYRRHYCRHPTRVLLIGFVPRSSPRPSPSPPETARRRPDRNLPLLLRCRPLIAKSEVSQVPATFYGLPNEDLTDQFCMQIAFQQGAATDYPTPSLRPQFPAPSPMVPLSDFRRHTGDGLCFRFW